MSEFQRKLFQNKLAKAEKQLGFDFSEDAEDNDEKQFGSLAPLPQFKKKVNRTRNNDEEDHKYVENLPKWSDFFDNNDIYREPASGYCFQTYYSTPVVRETIHDNENHPVIFIAHHGAGSSGLTFAKLSTSLKRQSKLQGYDEVPGLFTFDMRGHGSTKCLNQASDDNYTLPLDGICNDFAFILKEFYEKHFSHAEKKPSLFLLGHSLGGSVVTKIVYDQQNGKKRLPDEIFERIKGLVMVDIVEDTAVKALGSMHSYLQGVPRQFRSMKRAIDWHLDSGLLNSRKSAEISVPVLVYKPNKSQFYRWVTDLAQTASYWHTWFAGLSSHFTKITNAVSKMLILVNNDYLDKDLMIGQMQGKYQLVVFHNHQLELKDTLTTSTQTIFSEDSKQLGHFVQEDIPDKVAISLLEFVERNDYRDMRRRQNETVNTKMDLLNKLNAKWGVKK